ncbi:hypothetical protein B9Z55_014200 [Caenorhabditis nigoni]|uniref:Uncharacterized protein n=1 Tax=Caenorhabditis nigoni TaxID=1611254 RepID=A0A2G5U4X2_9PELO|nr:hypothetical protein B9Z55_014200 [Caenorhabditis nigoni]
MQKNSEEKAYKTFECEIIGVRQVAIRPRAYCVFATPPRKSTQAPRPRFSGVTFFNPTIGADVIITDLPERIPLLEKNLAANKHLTGNRIKVQVLDWMTDKIPDGLDLVLAVDCVYYNSTITPLIDLLKKCDAKEIIVVSEERDIGEASVAQKTFFKNITEFFQLIPISQKELDPDYCADDIIIGKLIRNV